MDQNKLRKLAGLPVLTEAKKKKDVPADAMQLDVVPAAGATDTGLPPVDDKKKKDDKPADAPVDDLPAIISKIALKACKKFGIGDPKGGESADLTAMQDFLKQVYDAGVKDGGAKGGKKISEALEVTEVKAGSQYENEAKAIRANSQVADALNDFIASPRVNFSSTGKACLFTMPHTGTEQVGIILGTNDSITYNTSSEAIDKANDAVANTTFRFYQFKNAIVIGHKE